MDFQMKLPRDLLGFAYWNHILVIAWKGVSTTLALNLYFTVFIDIFSATEFWTYF